ncbi:cytochrome oxidase assembly protein [Leifsonia xyli subsp. cynodontis DSM 46306]|jgi:cytochrome c oxidase assembly protein subunit 15|uniref:Cytochrome oxidase assembly protein n=1 Tax=Leifsonia xyli subsp. cynodontis DSM 46306 TaxID=1389489 RepID=U3P7B7_LEIXC|nr:COX15/CtaA family protein [Leifsonia xyli]AGW41354.1 cytochrome oxidase assembly protein [Leifsonia xyli subsp. cynodontis DSM 46306]
MNRIIAWLPDRVDARLTVIAWIYLIGQIVLVGTGGLVRLTSSGLGCPTWPKCTADSLVNTPEMGIHGIIEFGNRVLGIALGLIAIVAFIAVLRLRRERKDLFWLTLLAGLGIPAQAVIGGLSVLTKLNPYVVGLHFVVSIVLVALCMTFLLRLRTAPGPRARAVPGWFAGVAHLTSAAVAVTILAGILTTGSGPHAGDADAPRNGLNPEILQHVHALPAYATLALTLVLVVGSLGRRAAPVRRCAMWLLAVEALQIAVGLVQANTGLPGILVGVHMMLAAALAAAMTAVVLTLKAPAEPRTDTASTAA